MFGSGCCRHFCSLCLESIVGDTGASVCRCSDRLLHSDWLTSQILASDWSIAPAGIHTKGWVRRISDCSNPDYVQSGVCCKLQLFDCCLSSQELSSKDIAWSELVLDCRTFSEGYHTRHSERTDPCWRNNSLSPAVSGTLCILTILEGDCSVAACQR